MWKGVGCNECLEGYLAYEDEPNTLKCYFSYKMRKELDDFT